MARLDTYYHESYDGGLHDTSDPTEIERNEASLLRNWDITFRGQLRRRDGLIQVGDSLSDGIDGANNYLRTTGALDMMIMNNGSLRYLNGTTFDALDTGFTAGTETCFEYCPLNDKLYITNEDDTTHSWDRSSTTLNSCLVDLGASVPAGNVALWHKNHMFIANNAHVSGSTYEHRIYWSALGDPDTWDTTNDFIEVPGKGRVIALADLGNTLVIYKEYSIQYLTGWGDTDWRITASSSNVSNISEAVGIIGVKAHTRVGNEVWYMDDEGSIRRLYQTDFDPFRQDIISTKVQGTLDGMNTSFMPNVVAHTNNDKVYFAIPTGSNTFNDKVMVYDVIASKRSKQEAWTTYTGWTSKFFFDYPTSDVPIMHVVDKDSKVWKHEGQSDGATAIDARWDGKNDDFDRPERYKRYKFGYTKGLSAGNTDIEIHASVDNAVFADLGDLTLATVGGTLAPTGFFELFPTGTTAILGGGGYNSFKFYFTSGGGSPTGKSLRMSIRHNIADKQPSISEHTVHYKQRQLR